MYSEHVGIKYSETIDAFYTKNGVLNKSELLLLCCVVYIMYINVLVNFLRNCMICSTDDYMICSSAQ